MKKFSAAGDLIAGIQEHHPEWTNQAICVWLKEQYPNSSISIRNLQLIKSGGHKNPSTFNAIALVNFINQFKEDTIPLVTVEDLFDERVTSVFYRASPSKSLNKTSTNLEDIVRFIEEFEKSRPNQSGYQI